MATVFKTPADIATEYLTNLKVLKPTINRDQTDSDWYIRGQVVGGVVAGLYADQRRIADDAFPQSARHDALDRHLFVYFNGTFRPATSSTGSLFVTGTPSSIIPIGTQFVHTQTGNSYQSTTAVTLTASTGQVPVVSVNLGQANNLLTGAVLTVSTPPAGIGSSATALFPGIANGTDAETDQQAAQRILDRIRAPISGGTAADYRQWARDADSSVTSSSVFRYLYGLGTVGIYITAGTADIDAAVDGGQAIVRIPSDSLVTAVQAYIDALKPLTDCATVLKPNEVNQNVTVNVTYAQGFSGSSVLAGQTLTLNQLVQREVGRALYKIPTGGRTIGASGYVVASEIEEALDIKLSGDVYTAGEIAQVLIDRQVQNLAATGVNRLLAGNEIVAPGTITVVEV